MAASYKWQIKSALIGLFFACLSLPSLSHQYYFSTTDLSWNQKTHSFEWVITLTTHDLEYALTALHNHKVNLDSERGRSLLKHHVLASVMLQNESATLPLNYIGEEISHKATVVYIESPVEQLPEQLTVHHRVLMDVFKAQVNLVNIRVGELKASMSFEQDNLLQNIVLDKNIINGKKEPAEEGDTTTTTETAKEGTLET